MESKKSYNTCSQNVKYMPFSVACGPDNWFLSRSGQNIASATTLAIQSYF